MRTMQEIITKSQTIKIFMESANMIVDDYLQSLCNEDLSDMFVRNWFYKVSQGLWLINLSIFNHRFSGQNHNN